MLVCSLWDRTNHGKLRIGQPFFEQKLLSGGTRIGAFSPANVEKAVQHVIDLKRLTELRNASFHVLLLPTRYEARINRYSNLVYEFIESAQQRGVFFIDAIESFDPTDYWPHNGHFSPKGAAKAAKQILLNFNDV